MTQRALGLACLAGVVIGTGTVVGLTPKESCVGGYATTLVGRTRNQRHNALLSVQSLNGSVIKPGEVFSFNEKVGTFSRDAGYRKAPVSYNGTLIESWGGGVCQTSTTLYNSALVAGLKIIERHRHRFCPSYVAPGRDAAVAFGQIDLKFQNVLKQPITIRASMAGDRLVVMMFSKDGSGVRPSVVTDVRQVLEARSFSVGTGNDAKVRNSGKSGYDVATYRLWGDRKELVSNDHYPPMHRIVEYR